MDMEQNEYQVFEVNSSNPITGFIGALVGACLGGVVWIIIYQLGFLAAIAGLAIITGAFKGYEILGGRVDMKGLVISVIISLLMVFASNYICWVIECKQALSEYTDITFLETFKLLPDILSTFELTGDFVKDLLFGYLLAIVGGYSAVQKKLIQIQ